MKLPISPFDKQMFILIGAKCYKGKTKPDKGMESNEMSSSQESGKFWEDDVKAEISRNEKLNYVHIWGKSAPGWRKRVCKGSEAPVSLEHLMVRLWLGEWKSGNTEATETEAKASLRGLG